jgi:hypothetical protein
MEEHMFEQLILQKDMFMDRDIHVIGCGSLGSRYVESIVRACSGDTPTIHVWDDDTVEERNKLNQRFSASSVGLKKVDAMIAAIEQLYPGSGARITPHIERVTSATTLSGIVLAGVDSMFARKIIWGIVRENPDVSFYADGRMGLDGGKAFGLDPGNPEHIARYEDPINLHDDPPNLNQGCKTEFPMPFLADIVAGEVIIRLTQWLHFEQGCEHAYANMRAFNYIPTCGQKTEYWLEAESIESSSES